MASVLPILRTLSLVLTEKQLDRFGMYHNTGSLSLARVAVEDSI